MENALATLSIIAVALIFVAVVLYQRIYKITRNSIYVENVKKQNEEHYTRINELNVVINKQVKNLMDKIETQTSRMNKLESDLNAIIAALLGEDFGIEAENVNHKKEE